MMPSWRRSLRSNAPETVRTEWAKWMRGDLPSTTVAETGKNLVLFGDPESNPIIRRINAKLPIRWSGENIVAGEQRFPAREHTLALIYPNPLDPDHYVVLNSGLTFGTKEFQGYQCIALPAIGRLRHHSKIRWSRSAGRNLR